MNQRTVDMIEDIYMDGDKFPILSEVVDLEETPDWFVDDVYLAMVSQLIAEANGWA